MLSRLLVAAALCGSLLTLAPGAAHAGRTCEAKPKSVQAMREGMNLAERTAQALDATGANVVVLARSGQDLRKWGLRWSHIGLAYRSAPGQPWRVAHKLNHCGTDHAALYRQGLGEFFLDDPFEYRAGYAVLRPDVQAALLPVLHDNSRLQRLNERRYNMLAYPWATRYQQSNQWAIETLAWAVTPTADSRQRAQGWLMAQGYEPTTLRIDALTRLGGRMTRANIAFDDHPNAKRFSDRIETVTADSVFDWLARSGLGQPMVELR
jgi:hypothetical protein